LQAQSRRRSRARLNRLGLEPGRRAVWTLDLESADPAFAETMIMTQSLEPVIAPRKWSSPPETCARDQQG
jgi:hypothetical protein